MTTIDSKSRPLSRMERIGLFLHRESDKRLTPFGIWVMRRTKGGIVQGRIARMLGATREVDVLLLTTRGRKSGKERTVVLQFFPDGDDLVLAAANDGGASHPAWYHNLKATPAARVEVNGRTFAVRAEELSADEAAAFWPRLLRRAPSYERYSGPPAEPFHSCGSSRREASHDRAGRPHGRQGHSPARGRI